VAIIFAINVEENAYQLRFVSKRLRIYVRRRVCYAAILRVYFKRDFEKSNRKFLNETFSFVNGQFDIGAYSRLRRSIDYESSFRRNFGFFSTSCRRGASANAKEADNTPTAFPDYGRTNA